MSIIRTRATRPHLGWSLAVIAPLASLVVVVAGPPPGGGQYFFGMLHEPLGAAELAAVPAGLVISNIGSSGNDGVSIELSQAAPPGGVAPGWAGVLNFGPANPAATTMSVTIQSRDQLDNPVCSLHISETIDAGGGPGQTSIGVSAAPAFSPGSVVVRTLLDGAVLQTREFRPPFPPVLARGAMGFNGGSGIEVRTVREKHFINQFDVDLCEDIVRLPAPTLITLTGLSPEIADAVAVRLNGLPPGTRYIGNLAVMAGDVSSVVVESEALVKRGKGKVKFFNEAKGFGRIIGGGDLDGDGLADIVVSNIGPSGQDGVTLAYNDAYPADDDGHGSHCSVEADWGDAGDLPTGSVMRWIVDTAGPTINEFALVVTETGDGGATVSVACADPDCCTSPPCAGMVVEALRHGVVVDRVVHDATPSTIATGDIGSNGPGGVQFSASMIDSCVNFVDDRYLLGLREYDPTMMTLTGSPSGPVSANELRVTAHVGDVGAVRSGILQMASAGGPGAPPGSFTILDGGARPEFVADLTHDGLPHMALGGASLDELADGSLRIHGDWDGDGDDTVGVSIRLGEADGWASEIDFGPAGLPAGAEMHVKALPRSEVVKKIWLSGSNGGSAALSFEQDICPPCAARIWLLRDGQVVASATYPPPYPPQLVTGVGTSSTGQVPRLNFGSGRIAPFTSDKLVVDFVTIESPMTLSGHPPVSADRVLITMVPVQPGDDLDLSMTAVELTVEGIPEVDFRVGEERILNDYNIADSVCPNIALGGATMCSAQAHGISGGPDLGASLTVANIGSSGNDGVRIESPDEDGDGVPDLAARIEIAHEGLKMQPGGHRAINTNGHGATVLAGSITWDAFVEIEDIEHETEEITVDFSALGARTHHAAIYLDGALQAQVSGQSGTLVATRPADIAADIEECKKRPVLKPVRGARGSGSNETIEMSLGWVSPAPITLARGVVAVGDRLTITAENPTVIIEGITSMSLTGADILGDAFTIIDETVVLIPCPGDVNGSGTVNVTDLLALIAVWGPGGGNGPADLNKDGTVNVTDLLALIANWGPC